MVGVPTVNHEKETAEAPNSKRSRLTITKVVEVKMENNDAGLEEAAAMPGVENLSISIKDEADVKLELED